jgi:endonuclease-8
MPEGPSIVILRELVEDLHLENKRIIEVTGNTKLDKERLLNQKVKAFKSWGKHFLICFEDFAVRIHFMLFGSYRINEEKDAIPRLGLHFNHATLNFYACSIKFIEGDLKNSYDWEVDVMSDNWNAKKAIEKLKKNPHTLVCDALLDQNIFSGVGNIIKNEVLYRIGVSPLNTISQLPANKIKALVREASAYSFDFLTWKKEFSLKKHWLAHTKKACPKGHPIIKEYLGKTNRRTFYCPKCQKRYEAN